MGYPGRPTEHPSWTSPACAHGDETAIVDVFAPTSRPTASPQHMAFDRQRGARGKAALLRLLGEFFFTMALLTSR